MNAVLGGEFLDEQMEILKLIFEKSSKYMLSPDLDIAVNINGKVSIMLYMFVCLFVCMFACMYVQYTVCMYYCDVMPARLKLCFFNFRFDLSVCMRVYVLCM